MLQVDYYRMCVLPVLKKLIPGEGLELKVLYHTGVSATVDFGMVVHKE